MINKEWKIREVNKCVEDECPEVKKMDKEGVLVMFSHRASEKVLSLCREYESLEWLCGLEGKVLEDGNYQIEDIHLFEQEVSGSTVELTDKGSEDMAKMDLIGWIHSHNNMGVFLSCQDIETAQFNEVSICVNNKLEFYCKVKKKLPCNRDLLVEAKVLTNFSENQEIKLLAKELIKEKKYIQPQYLISSKDDIQSNSFCFYCGYYIDDKDGIKVDGEMVHKDCYDLNKADINTAINSGAESFDEYIQNYVNEYNDIDEEDYEDRMIKKEISRYNDYSHY